MLVGVLICLNKTESLVHGSSYRQIVHGYLTQVLFVIDDEKSTEGNSGLLVEDTVITGDLGALVRQQRNIHITKTALLARRIYPCEVTEVGIGGRCDHLTADVGELLHSVGESDNFRRAHESKVQRVEEEHEIFALVVGEFNVLELSVHNSGTGESGRRFLELWHWHDYCCFVAIIENKEKLYNPRSRTMTPLRRDLLLISRYTII